MANGLIKRRPKKTCPFCKAKVTKIGVVSEYNQVYDMETEEWDSSDAQIGPTIYTFCLECGVKLPQRFEKLVS